VIINPKISVITVCRNAGSHIRECIESVITQEYENVEFIIIDGASDDDTLAIIDEFKDRISCFISEPDNGPADALNKGFEKSTGDILCWLNADDKFHPYALSSVAKVFSDLPSVNWITGFPTWYNNDGVCLNELFIQQSPLLNSYVHDGVYPHFNRWSRTRFLSGDFLAIQQESVFWRKALWEKAGSKIGDNIIAFDFELWSRFFEFDELFTVPVLFSGFRVHGNQLSSDQGRYLQDCESVFNNSSMKLSSFQKIVLRIKVVLSMVFKPFYYVDFPVIKHVYPALMSFPALIKYSESSDKFVIDYI